MSSFSVNTKLLYVAIHNMLCLKTQSLAEAESRVYFLLRRVYSFHFMEEEEVSLDLEELVAFGLEELEKELHCR